MRNSICKRQIATSVKPFSGRTIGKIILFFFVTSSLVFGAELTSVRIDGVLYENVRWGVRRDDTVSFSHSRGVGWVDLAKVPRDVQLRYGYDAVKVRAATRHSEIDKKERDKVEERNKTLLASVPPTASQSEIQAFLVAAQSNVVVHGKIVLRSSIKLQSLRGVVRAKGSMQRSKGHHVNGTVIELYKYSRELVSRELSRWQRMGASSGIDSGPVIVTKRSLSGERAFLEFETEKAISDDLNVEAVEENPLPDGTRRFAVAMPLTFELWKKTVTK